MADIQTPQPDYDAIAQQAYEWLKKRRAKGEISTFEVLMKINDALRSSHRREDDIRRFKFHAVCGFSLERISTTKLVFCLYLCKRVLQGVGGKL